MTVDKVLDMLRTSAGEALTDPELRSRTVGVARPQEIKEVWAGISGQALVPAVRALADLAPLHLSVISGRDAGEDIELLYHMTVGYGTEGGEVLVTLRLMLPKTALRVPSLCGLIPGAETTEREKREFLGVAFEGITDDRNLFLPDDVTAHPWRADDEEIGGMVRRTVKWEERNAGT